MQDFIVYNFFIDNCLYRNLIKTGNEDAWNRLYESLIAINPNYKGRSFDVIFTALSLLEAIGLGKIKEKTNIFNELQKPKLETEDQILKAPCNIYDEAFTFLSNHEELQPEKLIKHIEEQYIYSKSKASTDLVKKTLISWQQYVESNRVETKNLIIGELAWDVTCCFRYYNLTKKTPADIDAITSKAQLLYHVLYSLWIKLRNNNLPDLNSYRITDRNCKMITSTQPYRSTAKQAMGSEKINSIKLKAELDIWHDLSDAEMIHFVTLGKHQARNKNNYEPVVALTCDSKEIIKDRVILQLSNLKKFESEANIKFVPGFIYFADKNCKITGEINVANLLNETGISAKVNHSYNTNSFNA